MYTRVLAATAAFSIPCVMAGSLAMANEVNLYTSRHYDTDIILYERFTEQTGIVVNVIEDKAGALLERIRSEGENSPADVFLAADVGNLERAAADGLLQSTASDTLNNSIPSELRHPDGMWYAFTRRARIIMVRRDADIDHPERYEDLADPRYAHMICIRSSGNVYNQSLVSSLIIANGEEATTEWVKGLVANMAREPESNDTGQIKAVAAGECEIAVANSYYLARLMRSSKEEDVAVAEAIVPVLPNQGDRGTHINISGAGVVAHSPNAENAVAFLEFLASADAQAVFADRNNEWPVLEGVARASVLDELYGEFKADSINLQTIGAHRGTALSIMESNGWK